MLSIHAIILRGSDSINDLSDMNLADIDIFIILMVAKSKVLMFNELRDVPDVGCQVLNRDFHSFEGDQDFSFSLDSLSVVLLIPNLLVFIEFIHLLIEIGSGELFWRWQIVVIWTVIWDLKVARVWFNAIRCLNLGRFLRLLDDRLILGLLR